MDTKRLIVYPVLLAATLAIATLGFTEFGTDGLFIPFLVVMGYFTAFYIAAQVLKNNSIVDIGWGFGFVLGAWTTLAITEEPTVLSYAIVAFITLWGLRLSLRLLRRNWRKPEDFRYAQWRKEWGKNATIIAFFKVFMIQGIINFIVGAAGYTVIKFNVFALDNYTAAIVILGFVISLTGLFFEVVGDEQLRRHIKRGESKLLTTGLWSLTRHPNYFGEILIWSGLYLTGASLIDAEVSMLFYAVLILSPIIMSTVLIKISTPLLERNMKKYEGWDEYAKKTPMLFPWGKKG